MPTSGGPSLVEPLNSPQHSGQPNFQTREVPADPSPVLDLPREPLSDEPHALPNPSNPDADRLFSNIQDSGPQETPVLVPVGPPEPPASHFPAPELRITEPPLNLDDSPQAHGTPPPVVELAPGSFPDTKLRPTVAEAPDTVGSNRAVAHGFETKCVAFRPALLPILNSHSAELDRSSRSQHT